MSPDHCHGVFKVISDSALINTHLSWATLLSVNLPPSFDGEDLTYCPKCGAKLKDEDKFCYACGAAAAKITREEFSISADSLIEKIKQILHEGTVTRIIVKDDKDNVLLEIPATVGVIGAVLAPWLAALGVIAALFSKCKIVVEKRE